MTCEGLTPVNVKIRQGLFERDAVFCSQGRPKKCGLRGQVNNLTPGQAINLAPVKTAIY